ncbi:MAG TPA: hypothetical protein VLI05_04945 [Candidatus Saccharimonadia bacterium]|nr:hypothetical protein [Candidatus Saccharimonadia bacterium]
MTEELYRQVVEVTEEYLGPAAPRFVARQISFHLNKLPHELRPEDLPKLIEWARATLGLLTEDRQLVAEYAHKLSQLARTKSWQS